MFRLMGCILIFISCSCLGFIKASSYKARTIELENTLELIRLLNMEIVYKKESLAKTFKKVSEMKSCWFSQVLRSCSLSMQKQNTLKDSWQKALEDNMKNCPLKENDIKILQDISIGLGKSDIRGQKNIMEPAVIRMETSLTEARQQEKKESRMYRGLGVAAGVVIAVMLI